MINIEGYIISPFVFYLISMLGKLLCVSTFFLFASAMLAFISFCCENKEVLNYSIISFLISLFLLVFIPDRDTCYKMLLAKAITYENINSGKEVVKYSIDYLVNKIIDIK